MRKFDWAAGQEAPPECRFNVAASIKMRKSHEAAATGEGPPMLQCGRIYKDAEMSRARLFACHSLGSFNVAASIKMRK